MRVVVLALLCFAVAQTCNAYIKSEPMYVVRMWPKSWPLASMTFYPKFQPALAMANAFYNREAEIRQSYVQKLVVMDFDCTRRYAVNPYAMVANVRHMLGYKRLWRIFMIFPQCTGLRYAGEAYTNARFAYVQLGGPQETVPQLAVKIAHEMGHLYGVGHALGPAGQAYGNPYSVMGGLFELSATTRLTVVERNRMNYYKTLPVAPRKWTTTNAKFVISGMTTLWVEFRSKTDVRVYATTPTWQDYLQLVANATGTFQFKGVSAWKDPVRFNVTIATAGQAPLNVTIT